MLRDHGTADDSPNSSNVVGGVENPEQHRMCSAGFSKPGGIAKGFSMGRHRP